MTPRFSDDLHEIDDAPIKTAVIDMELTRLQMDKAARFRVCQGKKFTFFGSWDPSPADVRKFCR